jgi:hypothetical protein
MTKLSCAFEPLHGLFFQGVIIAKGHACRAAASAANTFVSIHIYGALLIQDGVDSAHRFGKTGLAVVSTDNVQHIIASFYPKIFSTS